MTRPLRLVRAVLLLAIIIALFAYATSDIIWVRTR